MMSQSVVQLPFPGRGTTCCNDRIDCLSGELGKWDKRTHDVGFEMVVVEGVGQSRRLLENGDIQTRLEGRARVESPSMWVTCRLDPNRRGLASAPTIDHRTFSNPSQYCIATSRSPLEDRQTDNPPSTHSTSPTCLITRKSKKSKSKSRPSLATKCFPRRSPMKLAASSCSTNGVTRTLRFGISP